MTRFTRLISLLQFSFFMDMQHQDTLWWVVGVLVATGLGYLVFTSPAVAPAPFTIQSATPAVTSTSSSAPPLALGMIAPLTGSQAKLGEGLKRAAELATEGRNITLSVKDGGCEAKKGATAAQALIDEGVAGVIGGGCTAETLGAARLLNMADLPTISPSASASSLTLQGGEAVFRLVPSDALEGQAAALYARQTLKATRIAIISERDENMEVVATRARASAAPALIVAHERMAKGGALTRAQLVRIRNARAGTVIVVASTAQATKGIVQALQAQRVTAPMIATSALLAPEVLARDGKTLEGVTVMDPGFKTDTTEMRAFVDAYTEKYNEAPAFPWYQANAFAAVRLFEEVSAGGTSSTMTKLTAVRGWSGGALSAVSFDKNGDLEWPTFQARKIEGGMLKDAGEIRLTP